MPSPLPPLKVVIEGLQEQTRRFAPAERKRIMAVAMEAGAQWWIAHYLPLRFTMYAFKKLGYRIKPGSIRRKKHFGAPQPLVWTGDTQKSVFATARVKTGGSAKNPWAEVRMQTGGPRAAIVYQVLSTIIDSETPGVGREVARVVHELLNQATVTARFARGNRAGQVKRQTLAGAVSVLGSPEARAAQAAYAERGAANRLRLGDAEDLRQDLLAGREAGRARAQRALKRTHDLWRRRSGGSAARDDAGPSRTYLGSQRYRHALSQRQHRRRYSLTSSF